MSTLYQPTFLTGYHQWLHIGQLDDYLILSAILFFSVYVPYYKWSTRDPYHHVWFEVPQSHLLAGDKAATSTRDIGAKLAKSDKDVVIFWGSQSGTAETMASRLARDLKNRFGLGTIAADLSDYDPETIANIPGHKFAIFLISTYGDGDPSDNATPFMAWLASNKTVQFENLRYAAFGLGNKNYKFYNKVVDVLTETLYGLGSKPILPVGRADDSNGGTEEDFTSWKQDLFSVFSTDFGYKVLPTKYTPTLRVIEDTSLDIIDLHAGEPVQVATNKKTAMPLTPVQAIPVKSSRKMLKSQYRNCLHVDLDISGFVGLKYNTGDHVAVWPSNPQHEVDRLMAALGLQEKRSTPLLISSLEPTSIVKIPSPIAVETLFLYHLEVCAPIGREAIQALAQFAPSTSAKSLLGHISRDKTTYDNHFSHNPNTLGHILLHTSLPNQPWSQIPLSFVIEILPVLSARHYSISSSSIVQPKLVSLTVATSTHDETARPVPGLTTNYLLDLNDSLQSPASPSTSSYNLNGPNNLLLDHKVFAHIRKSKFRLPVIAKYSIIMVASGSGIAPFRAFLQERLRLASMGRVVGRSLLFFGCRSADEYLYKDELEDMARSSNGLITIVTAFSRQQEQQKRYVQDRIEEMKGEVTNLLLEEDANLYLCGSARMARDVAGRLGECLGSERGWGSKEIVQWSEKMKKTNKWQEDVWR